MIASTGFHGCANHQTSFFMAENNPIVHIAQSLKTRAESLSWLLEIWKAVTPGNFQGQPDVLASILASAPKSHFASWLSQTLYLVPTSPSGFLPKARLFKKAGVNSPFCLRSSIPFLDSLSPPISCCVHHCLLGPALSPFSSSGNYLCTDTFVMPAQQPLPWWVQNSTEVCAGVVCALMPPGLKKNEII